MDSVATHTKQSPSLMPAVLKDMIGHRILIAELVRRHMGMRTSGTVLGLLWWVLTPLILLIAYMFAFRFIMGVRWPEGAESAPSTMSHATRLFAGLIVYQFFSESIIAASSQILNNEQYARRVVFPIQVLPVVPVATAAVGLLISTAVLIVMVALTGGPIHAAAIFAPIAMLPALLCALGLAWFAAAFCVFVRDIEHLIRVGMLGVLFLSPIFYPLSRLEDAAGRWIAFVHPLAVSMEQTRACVFDPSQIGSWAWVSGVGIGLALIYSGYAFFQRLRPAMVDVL